eukprot:3539827-Rhodomonas_salina.2
MQRKNATFPVRLVPRMRSHMRSFASDFALAACRLEVGAPQGGTEQQPQARNRRFAQSSFFVAALCSFTLRFQFISIRTLSFQFLSIHSGQTSAAFSHPCPLSRPLPPSFLSLAGQIKCNAPAFQYTQQEFLRGFWLRAIEFAARNRALRL